jgi:hypothetical protein
MLLTHQYMTGLVNPADVPQYIRVYSTFARSNPGAIWTPSGGLPSSCPAIQPYTYVLLFCNQTTAGVVGNGPILTVLNHFFFPPIVGIQSFPLTSLVAYNIAIIDGPPGGPTLPAFVEVSVIGRQLTSQNAEYFATFQFRWSASVEYLQAQWQARGGAYWVGGQTGTAIPLLNPCNHTVF